MPLRLLVPYLALLLWVVGVQCSEALASAGLGLCLVWALVQAWQHRAEAPRWLVSWAPLLVWAAWSLLAPLCAGRPPTGTGFARLLDWLALPAAAAAFSTLTPLQRRKWLGAGALVLLVSCALAGLQSYGLWPSAQTLAHVPGLHAARVYEAAPGGRFMGGGLLFHRLKFAHVSGLGVLLAFAVALHAHGRTRRLERNGGLAVAALALLSIALFPFARSATSARRRLLATGVAVVLLLLGVAAVAASPALSERFRSVLGAEGSGGRPQLWATGLAAARAHPWVGLGQGRFHPGDFVAPGVSVHDSQETVKAHDQYLTVAAEGGWVGLLLFLVLNVWLFVKADPRTAGGAAARGALVFFALLSVAHDPLFHAPFSMALVLVLGRGVRPGTALAPVDQSQESSDSASSNSSDAVRSRRMALRRSELSPSSSLGSRGDTVRESTVENP